MKPRPISEPAAGQALDRFTLQRVVGRGAQAVVWLAHDGRLDRDVALKLPTPAADAGAVTEWLHEARAVSRLTHPHIVPVFEAGEAAGRPYLVFEYVAGPTLAEMLRQRGALPAHEAAALMLGVLAALRVAHASAIVHRDLKPSNVLVDDQGRARVMDFGIAARLTDHHDSGIYGTPGYMSPEAAQGLTPTPSMDVFAAGMMLGEMLCGRRLLGERDPIRAIERVVREDMRLPDAPDGPIDDLLRAIVGRAIARDPALRYDSADAFHQALASWLQPAPPTPANGAAGALEFLLRRMRHKNDFPTLSASVACIQRVTSAEHENLSSLSNAILRDVALTNKLLRLVNSAHYRGAGGPVSTVSRAVALVGFAGIRNMALSLVLFEHMNDRVHAQQLKEEFLRALMAATLAGELMPLACGGEEAFLGAMFQNLGRLLTGFYFPEEAQQIRARLDPPAGASAAPACDDEQAALQVLGVGFEALGLGVARAWGLPESLQRAMRRPRGTPPARPAPPGPERVGWLGQASQAVVDAMLQSEHPAARIDEIARRYAAVLDVRSADITDAAERARLRMGSLVDAMGLHVPLGTRARRLLASPAAPAHDDSLSPHQLDHATLTQAVQGHGGAAARGLVAQHPRVAALQACEMLAAGIQDITNQMVEDFRLPEVLRMILETMWRALDLRRVVFCLRDPKGGALTGRFGLGDGVEAVSAMFRVPLKAAAGDPPDLFSVVCLRGADTLIADATSPAIAGRLPRWYRERVAAPSFLLLPMQMKGEPFALIYADQRQAGSIMLGEKELSLLRTLRNQAVMAFKQAG